MDLPFLSHRRLPAGDVLVGFNPYSNGSSFFITFRERGEVIENICFNPYSNGSSFFISELGLELPKPWQFQSLF